MAELQREVAWKERELLRQVHPVCHLPSSIRVLWGRVVENLSQPSGIFTVRKGTQGHVSSKMLQDPMGSGEMCCAVVPPLPQSLAPAHEFSLVSLGRRPPTFLSPLKIDSPNEFAMKSIASAKEKDHVYSPWARFSLSPRTPTSTLACHKLCGVLVASSPREAPKRQAKVEGVSRLCGESSLHSPTVYFYLLRESL